MKNEISYFEIPTKIIGLSTIILLVAGYIDLKLFYSNFNININEYITSGEIILIAIDRLFLVLISLCIQFLIWWRISNSLFDYNAKEVEAPNKELNRQYLFGHESPYRLLKNKRLLLLGGILVLGIALFSTLRNIFPSIELFHFLRSFFTINAFIFQILYLYLLIFSKSLWDYFEKKDAGTRKVGTAGILLIMGLAGAIWLNNYLTFGRIKRFGATKEVILFNKSEEIIKPTQCLNYVGSTANYYFFWNNRLKQALIYPKGEMKLIITK